MNQAWERLSVVGTRVHHVLRDQVFNGGRIVSDRLHSLGEPGNTLLQGGLILFMARNPSLTVDQFHWIGDLPEPFRQRFWEEALEVLENRGVDFPREEMKTYDQFTDLLHRNGISYDDRIRSLETALHLLHLRRHPEEAGRERSLAVVVANIDDHNGAFASTFVIDDLVRGGRYDVVYFEAGSDHEAMGHLYTLSQQTGGREIDAFVIGGHGTRTSLLIGKHDRPLAEVSDSDAPWLDVGDLRRGEWSGLNSLLAPGAHVILWACSNGAPEEEGAHANRNQILHNLADELALSLPGRTIHATETPNNIAGIAFDLNGSPVLTWWEDRPHVVRSSPQGTETVAEARDWGILPRPLVEIMDEVDEWMDGEGNGREDDRS